MILQCSECQARFLVPDQAIGPKGRDVRCGKCSHTWFQQASPIADTQILSDLDSLLDEINARPKPMGKGSNLPVITSEPVPLTLKITALTMGAIAAGLALLVAMPGLYGLPHSKGLALADVGVVREVTKDNHTIFHINGKIANTSTVSMKLPTLRVTLVDNEGTSLQYWDYSGDMSNIEPGKNLPFATGDLDPRFSKGSRFVVEVGNPLELALRRKPE